MTTPDYSDWRRLCNAIDDNSHAIAALAFVLAVGIVGIIVTLAIGLLNINKTLKASEACTDCPCAWGVCQCKTCDGDIVERSE